MHYLDLVDKSIAKVGEHAKLLGQQLDKHGFAIV
jgi:hypothetical protein